MQLAKDLGATDYDRALANATDPECIQMAKDWGAVIDPAAAAAYNVRGDFFIQNIRLICLAVWRWKDRFSSHPRFFMKDLRASSRPRWINFFYYIYAGGGGVRRIGLKEPATQQ